MEAHILGKTGRYEARTTDVKKPRHPEDARGVKKVGYIPKDAPFGLCSLFG